MRTRLKRRRRTVYNTNNNIPSSVLKRVKKVEKATVVKTVKVKKVEKAAIKAVKIK
jgi:hypothetical protein